MGYLTKFLEASAHSYFIQSWGENRWIQAFPMRTGVKWNAHNLVQNLNLGRRVRFVQRKE